MAHQTLRSTVVRLSSLVFATPNEDRDPLNLFVLSEWNRYLLATVNSSTGFEHAATPAGAGGNGEGLDARRARAMGFQADPDFASIIRAHVDDELGGQIA